MEDKKKFISLKEAAEISGYAPDYIGQLIRQGKLDGKQMYSGVAWVTTEEALHAYLREARGTKKNKLSNLYGYADLSKYGARADRVQSVLLYVAIGIAILAGLLMFYLLSVKIERLLEERSLHQIELLRTP